jgi:ribosomal protein S18 acetylase RimI-like enzyme
LFQIHIRKAKEEELVEVDSIIQEAYQSVVKALSRLPGALIDTKEKVNQAYTDKQLYILIDSSSSSIIGTFSLKYITENQLKIYHFAIKPSFQNRGIGSWTIEKIISRIQVQYPKVNEIILEVYQKIPELLKLYNKFGFIIEYQKEIRGEKIFVLSRKILL